MIFREPWASMTLLRKCESAFISCNIAELSCVFRRSLDKIQNRPVSVSDVFFFPVRKLDLIFYRFRNSVTRLRTRRNTIWISSLHGFHKELIERSFQPASSLDKSLSRSRLPSVTAIDKVFLVIPPSLFTRRYRALFLGRLSRSLLVVCVL